ncbi:MAG: SOS response-associated peptidase family protein [Ramlibacter sp.]|nr:SOS response-associated peptidase family protein [Ramlibacter sp.]
MCNRYHPTGRARIRDLFGFVSVESVVAGPQDWPEAIGPLQPGPFIRPNGLHVGQWGLTPDHSRTLKPTRQSDGKTFPMSTNNLRVEKLEGRGVLAPVWSRGQRCLVPADSYDEPYWGTGKNIWWRFARADGAPWALAGVWNEWTDHGTGEVLGSYSMLTMNCDAHPLLKLMHKPEVDKATGQPLPAHLQDKRTVVPIERSDWDAWLNGTEVQARELIRLPALELYVHGAADPAKQVDLRLQ